MGAKRQLICPACWSESELVGEISSDDAARHFKEDTGSTDDFRKLKLHIEDLWKGNSCLRRSCLNCRLVFVDPFAAGDSLFYNLAHSSHVYPRNRWEYGVALDRIESLYGEHFSLLEIGAGNGEFLRDALNRGVSAESLVAMEFDEVGSSVIQGLGIVCLEGDIRDPALFYEKKFKVIAMFQVFEHLEDLDSFLVSLVDLLQDGGLVIVSVPNNKRTEFIEKSLGFIDMPPNHLSTWNHAALKLVFERNHLRMKYFEVEKANFFTFTYQFIYYSVLKRRQGGTKIEKRLLGFKSRKLRIFTFSLFAVLHFVLRFPKFSKFNSSLGGSQMAIFEKN